jgi:hypothetical protein
MHGATKRFWYLVMSCTGLEQDVKSLHEGAGRSAHVPAGGEDGSDDVPVEEGQHVMLSYEWWVNNMT